MYLPWIILFLVLCLARANAAGVVAQQQEVKQQRQEQMKQMVVQQVAQQRATQKALQQKTAQQILQNRPSQPFNSSLSKQENSPSQGQGDDLIFQSDNTNDRSTDEEVVDIQDIWQKLKTTSVIWTQMVETAPKVATVQKYIDIYKREGIIIRKPAEQYVQMIDDMSKENSTILESPFKKVLMLMAIIEYDFDNGQDKDRMAHSILGNKAYESNKKRLGLP